MAEARQCCEYCQTQQRLIGMPLVIDHIRPRALGGSSDRANLAASCHRCNMLKGAKITAVDPTTGTDTRLFNPRRDNWHEHFAWTEQATHIQGLTAIGRATVPALQLNNAYAVASRAIWVSEGWHPPNL
jgi:5-methylcytosine-specific restriction endonuclease McrA